MSRFIIVSAKDCQSKTPRLYAEPRSFLTLNQAIGEMKAEAIFREKAGWQVYRVGRSWHFKNQQTSARDIYEIKEIDE